MGHGAIVEATARGCTLLLVNGDLSNAGEPAALAEVKGALDSFGQLGGTTHVHPSGPRHYFVTRGNHDRWETGSLYSKCESAGNGLYDCFDDSFTAGFVPGTQHFSITFGNDQARYRFVGLDSNDGSTTGVLRQHELDFLQAELERGDPTIPLFHHPASATASLSGVPPVDDGLDVQDARLFRAAARQARQCRWCLRRAHASQQLLNECRDRRRTVFRGRCGEGISRRLHRGADVRGRLHGQLLEDQLSRTSRAWSERTRGEYLGLGPDYQLGALADRNWTYEVDARRRTHLLTA